MKKVMTWMSVLLAASTALKAQEAPQSKWYIKPYASYFSSITPVEYPSIGGLPSRDRAFTINPSGTQATQSEDIMKGSFGAGFRLGVAGGYRFSAILGMEVALNYYKSNRQDMSKQNGTYTGTGTALDGTTALSLESTGQVTAFDIAPALVIYIPNQNEMFKPYAKIGVIVPLGGYSENITKITDNTGTVAVSQGIFNPTLRSGATAALTNVYTQMQAAGAISGFNTPNPVMLLADVERVDETRSRPTVGIQTALGADFWLSKRVGINLEIEYRNVTVASKTREMQSVSGSYTIVDRANNIPLPPEVSSQLQGQLSLEAASESSKKINYHDHINVNDHNIIASGAFDPNRPADEVSNRLTFGGLGVSLGFKFRL